MKKCLMSMAIMVLFAMATNAQMLIGGRVSFSSESSKDTFKDITGKTKDSKEVTTTFVFSPKVGFELGEKFEVGGIISLSSSKTYPDKAEDKNIWSKKFAYALSPYANYTFASLGKFNFKAETVASFGQSIPSNKFGNDKITGNKTTFLSFDICPIVSYELGEHIELEAQLNFFGLSASSTITKDADDSDIKSVNNEFKLFGDSENIATTGFITIGFMYKF